MLGVLQGSILGSLLFNITLCHLLFLNMDTPYITRSSIGKVIEKSDNTLKMLFQWFSDNQMKANLVKCHFLCSWNSEVSLTIENKIMKNIKCKKLLDIKLYSKLSFISHINDIKKARQKSNISSRITPNMDFPKKRLLVNAFFGHNLFNNKINRLQERCLRLINSNRKSSFESLLEKDGPVSVHHNNLRTFAIELLKVFKDLSSVIHRSFSDKTTKSTLYEELFIFRYASCQNSELNIR